MYSSQAGREFFPRARVSILSAYIGTYLYVGTRAAQEGREAQMPREI